MNAYEFIIKMKEYASSGIQRVSRELGIATRRNQQFDEGLNRTESTSKRLGSSLGGLKSKLLGLFAGISVFAFTNQVIDARQEYERFDAVLTNTFQNKDVGQGALAMLTDFASKTPYQLNELTGSFVKLVNRGVLPTQNEMAALGDLASSQGKSFDQLTEAILDAQTGEFERMKEFGIRASKSGDKVSLAFKGVTKEVAMNDEAIKNAIISYGQMDGVAGSMDVISKTLGGRISNLKDAWWSFLVSVGDYTGGIFGDAISLISDGLDFLKSHLPIIAKWFNILGDYLSPLVKSIKEFVKVAFGIKGTGDMLQTFGNIMSGVLVVVDWFSTGLSNLLDWLQPVAPLLGGITIAWGVLNAVIAITPVGWIIIGIMAIITAIGMIIKYIDGWGQSWTALCNIVKIVWKQIKSDFSMGVDTAIFYFQKLKYSAFEIFDKIGQKIANVGQAIKKALDFDFLGAYDTLTKEVTSKYTKDIQNLEKSHNNTKSKWVSDNEKSAKDIKNEFSKVGVTVDTKGISKDFNKLKSTLSGATGNATGNAKNYFDFIGSSSSKLGTKQQRDKEKKNKLKSHKNKDSIVTGGKRHTNINITIGNVGTDTKIYVSSKEEGISNLGQKVKEELLRVINSANQMQTAQ